MKKGIVGVLLLYLMLFDITNRAWAQSDDSDLYIFGFSQVLLNSKSIEFEIYPGNGIPSPLKMNSKANSFFRLPARTTLSKQRWDDNTRIRVADYKGSQDIRDTFYNALHTTPNNIKKIWLRAQFTGRTIHPVIVNTIEEMHDTIIENPGTIGYVSVSAVPANVNILLQID